VFCECAVEQLKELRLIAQRADRLAVSYRAFVIVGMVRLILRRPLQYTAKAPTRRFAEFLQRFGALAAAAESEEHTTRMARLFWFPVELGVAREGRGAKAYGSGLISSRGDALTRSAPAASSRPSRSTRCSRNRARAGWRAR
jgi:hypothetical protein